MLVHRLQERFETTAHQEGRRPCSCCAVAGAARVPFDDRTLDAILEIGETPD
jgi:hypothetical protein